MKLGQLIDRVMSDIIRIICVWFDGLDPKYKHFTIHSCIQSKDDGVQTLWVPKKCPQKEKKKKKGKMYFLMKL